MSEARTLHDDEADAHAPELVHSTPEAGHRRRWVTLLASRFTLMILVPLALISLAVILYLEAGKIVSTENAYIKAHIVNVSAEISGTIEEVLVEENQPVQRGDILLRIDDRPFRLSLQRAEAMLAQIKTDLDADKLAYIQALSEIELFDAAVSYSATQLDRQKGLINASLGKKEDLDTAQYELDSAQRRVTIAQQRAETLLAKLQGDPDIPVTVHPAWLAARSDRDQAKLNLSRTLVRAPFSGMITNRPEPGDYVEQGSPITSIVADTNMWIEANFKETQMTHVRPGQAVEFEIDAYPGTHWKGRVESISRSTGAEFALLPPQNATGNWVKIVQRVPVKIELLTQHEGLELRAGMSSTVDIDTGHERKWQDLIPAFLSPDS